jgi:phosphate:Na+ symporter
MISPVGPEVEVISRQIANAHLVFNLVATIIWLPLLGILVKVVTKLVKGKDADRLPSEPVFLDMNVLHQPFAALMLVKKELSRLAVFANEMITNSKKAFLGNDVELANKVINDEENVDILQSTIVNYLSALFTNESLTEHQAKEVAGLMHVATDIEHVGDYCENIAEYAIDKNKKKYEFSEDAYEEIRGGYTDKMSFACTVSGDRLERFEENNRRVYLRTITQINKVFDVSAVSIPANDGTSISARSFVDGILDEEKKEALRKFEAEQRRKRLQLKLRLIGG